MSARQVLEDALRERGEEPVDGFAVLQRATKLQTPTGYDADARPDADPAIAELARQVVEGATDEEMIGLLFPSLRR